MTKGFHGEGKWVRSELETPLCLNVTLGWALNNPEAGARWPMPAVQKPLMVGFEYYIGVRDADRH